MLNPKKILTLNMHSELPKSIIKRTWPVNKCHQNFFIQFLIQRQFTCYFITLFTNQMGPQYSYTVQNAQNFNEYLKYLAISLGTSGVPTLEMNTLSFQLKIITSNNRIPTIKLLLTFRCCCSPCTFQST